MSHSPLLLLPVGAPYPTTYQLPYHYHLLLTSQYGAAPNLLAWLQAVLSVTGDIVNCLGQFPVAFDLSTAVGVQLDTLGVIVGQSRVMTFQPSNGVSPILDDTTFRLLLMARIAQNQWDGTLDGLQGTWGKLFPGGTIALQDSQNMTVTVLLTGVFTSIITDLITNGLIVPRPAGVLYQFQFSTLPAFGFDQDNSYIGGFGHGHF